MALCDIGEDLQIDMDTISEQMMEELDVLVPVHLMGYPADMKKIMALKEKYGWTVVEDSAEAFGTEIDGKKVGTFGDFGTFSFYVSHNIAAGELGLVITNDDEAAKIMRSMKNHGRVGDNMKFLHGYVGSNYKTNEFCAALGLASLEDSKETLAARLDNAKFLHDFIKNENVEVFPVPDNASLLGLPIRCKDEETKNELVKRLNDEGIETRDIFPNLANQDAYEEHFNPFDFPVANKLEKEVFYVGIHHFLSLEDLKKIVKVINGE